MKTLRNILAAIIIIVSVLAGLYVGGWLMLVGGIIQLVEACKSDPVSSSGIAYGIAKIILASLVGYLTVILGVVIAAVVGTGRKKFTLGRKSKFNFR